MKMLAQSENCIISKTDRSIENKIQCDDCEVAFKSAYHFENHEKSSQHIIKTGLNIKLLKYSERS